MTMTTMIFSLPDLASPLDAATVTKLLKALDGVESVHVSLKDREVHLSANGMITSGAIVARLKETG